MAGFPDIRGIFSRYFSLFYLLFVISAYKSLDYPLINQTIKKIINNNN